MIVNIRYGDLERDIPYTFTLVNAVNGEIVEYFRKKYVLFDAYFDFGKGKRMFKLCLPLILVNDMFRSLPVKLKRSELIKITLVKHNFGEAEIKEIKAVIDDK